MYEIQKLEKLVGDPVLDFTSILELVSSSFALPTRLGGKLCHRLRLSLVPALSDENFTSFSFLSFEVQIGTIVTTITNTKAMSI
jgi:hypothetical protein